MVKSVFMMAVASLVFATSPAVSGEDQASYKLHEYEGEKFQIYEPEDDRIAVRGMGFTAYITIHSSTGMYRESLDGWGTDRSSLEQALDAVCARILDRAKQPSKEELRKGLDEFYENLKSK